MVNRSKTLYQKTAIGKILQWTVRQEDHILKYEWGYTDSDNHQGQYEEVKPTSRNDAVSQASLIYLRKIDDRIRNGYKESISEAISANPITDFIFYPLPTCFAPPKPISAKPCMNKDDEILKHKPNSTIQRLINEHRLLAERKANGVRGYYVTAEVKKNKPQSDDLFSEEITTWELPEIKKVLYSRKMKDMSEHFRLLKEALDRLPLPPNTILDVEVTLGGGFNDEQFRKVSSMSPNTLPYEAADIYRKWLMKHPDQPLIAYCFDVLFYEGVCVLNRPYYERFQIICDIIEMIEPGMAGPNNEHFDAPIIYTDFEEAKRAMIEGEWEGLVLWDKNMRSEYWMNGKPKRLAGCWKWKNTKTADCVIVDLVPEKGDDSLVGALVLCQYDTNGKKIMCGQAGSGLSDLQKEEAWGWIGKVVKIEYDERMPVNDRGERCFRNPRVKGLHEDKTPQECIFEEEEE